MRDYIKLVLLYGNFPSCFSPNAWAHGFILHCNKIGVSAYDCAMLLRMSIERDN